MQTAFSLPDSRHAELDATERLAMQIVFGEFEGGVFNWQAGRWMERT